MIKFYESDYAEGYKSKNGTIICIERDNSLKKYYTVRVNEPGKRLKTVATRCTYEKAMQIVKSFES